MSHGTYGGYQAHRKRGEGACSACKEANAANSRAIREDAEQRRKDRWWNSTARAARVQLAAEYPERYAEILAAIRAERLDQM